ncbi:hypothetical protein TNIN_392651 [Trichonephila inaurata madagascariensis]|uniref:Uncharacterized protein n=1 Tax=Trichonephila inaurata madagascariensis TaxID=2747483 RepID=A0A8X6X5P7_9ARAC|nr:hypothetical protein TNIN_392651 [Trichonephila inaurata madagascariensis]
MTAETVAATVIREWIPRFGSSSWSDYNRPQGRQFERPTSRELCACWKLEDINATAAEMVYGTTIRLPSDFSKSSGYEQRFRVCKYTKQNHA